MQRKTRIWVGLGAAVLVSGGGAQKGDAAGAMVTPTPRFPEGGTPANGIATDGPERLYLTQAASSGEGGPGEGGGQVLGSITEFRLNSTDKSAFDYDASAQVNNYVGLVHDAYAAAHDGVTDLQVAIDALLDDPTPQALDAARKAWVDARPAYLRTEAFQFYSGPVDQPDGPLPRLNAWPIDPDYIDGLIGDSTVSLNFRSLARLNRSEGDDKVTAGWHVIEYLLWGRDGARPASDFAAGSDAGDRLRQFLTSDVKLLGNDLKTLVAAWAPKKNNYRAAVETMDRRNAIGRAFNGMAVLVGYEIPLRRIGAGLFPANEDFQESPYAGTTGADNLNAFKGARAVYYGSKFDTLLASLDADLAQQVDASFGRAGEALTAMESPPYSRFLAPAKDSPARAAAEDAVRALTDLGRDLRAAGNRMGVLVLVPGL